MFDPDTDARRMFVRERHHTLALDALRPDPAHAPEGRGTSSRRRRRAHLWLPATHLRTRLALLGGSSKQISAATVNRRKLPQGEGQQ